MMKKTLSKIRPNIMINVWVDGSGGYYCYAEDMVPKALIELELDQYVRDVMHKEYAALMRRRNE